ncbi:hypothetical protein G6652_04915 [Polynucleobacter paneuropaeus]|jgi:dTDP-4-amino-4,6-dideoxygalactose transaminase|nr:hypothetical protein [Polynucleobacter paneuropaeus]MBT8576703.1 hypothetical protein [Polynucleobacter paneuropaeus]MBT8615096.1 hypothetical protein [Polynucleobacter paneuropaeus]MBT8616577.1 hypothetical protein [Polynucleobacter paneuropaeus]MBT8618458.1 hypothetical protein [Polynucleobacter paneuropaeus]
MIKKYVKLFKALFFKIKQISKKNFYGFTYGHYYLNDSEILEISQEYKNPSVDIVGRFESEFANLVGDGKGVAFASARMGFYSILKALSIGAGDEVILTGATCSVMVNAVIRVGARPIFSDIDPNSYGSCPNSISGCLTKNTKLIVAQHSFGIPCEIFNIKDIADRHSIFLLEDCALTLGSTINEVQVGNIGQAAIFSFDRTKPMSAVTGGMVYTSNLDLYMKVRNIEAHAANLPDQKITALFDRFNTDRVWATPSRYKFLGLIDLFQWLLITRFNKISPFLDDDFHSNVLCTYPYPAKMPSFIAKIGLIEISRWQKVSEARKRNLNKILEAVKNCKNKIKLPPSYADRRLNIVPLRFVWHHEGGGTLRKRMGNFIDIGAAWFMRPIISTIEPIETYGYIENSCPISEEVGSNIFNLPCNFSGVEYKKFINLLHKEINEL